MSVAQKDILNGWKEIAGYVARDIRTVERWEKQRGLPVRRVPGAGRATVYARISELEQWLAGATLDDGGEAAVGDPVLDHNPRLTTAETAPAAFEPAFGTYPQVAPATIVNAPLAQVSAGTFQQKFIRSAAGMGMVILLVAGTVFLERHRHATAEAHSLESKPANTIPYVSPVAGVEDLYLRGTYFYEQRTPETLNSALASFRQAITLDPHYAPAYAGLANTYNLLREYSGMPDSEAFPKAKEAAQKAISLDPNFAQAHAALGYVEYYWSMEPKPAEQEFRSALALSPDSAEARHWYGSMLTHEGRYTEALEQLAIAQRLQPSSAAIFTSRAMALGLGGHAEESRTMLLDQLSHDAAAQDRNSTTTHLVLSMVDMAQPRNVGESLAELRQAAALRANKDQLKFLDVAEPAFHAGGERAMWQAIAAHEEKLAPKSADHYLMAEAEANLGDFDSAFADLDRLADEKNRALVGMSMNPMFTPLRDDPRFKRLRTKIGLPSQN